MAESFQPISITLKERPSSTSSPHAYAAAGCFDCQRVELTAPPGEHAVKRIYKRRKETVERFFADAKQLHGYHYARFRGLLAVTAQCLLAAAAQNIKKWPWLGSAARPGLNHRTRSPKHITKQNPAKIGGGCQQSGRASGSSFSGGDNLRGS